MLTVAFIGIDGSGKSTVIEKIQASHPRTMKYLYMGMNIQSSNVALPTSRLIFALKVYKYRKSRKISGDAMQGPISLHTIGHRQDKRGKIGATFRLFNRLSEALYRQLVSWIYQLRGYTVLYDRHFYFDAPIYTSKKTTPQRRLTSRLHEWFLHYIYPKPDLVIFIDTPPDVAYARKQEVPIDYLQKTRNSYLEKGKMVPNFIRIDGDQSPEDVYNEVNMQISEFHKIKYAEVSLLGGKVS